jgi:hypothetical protein
MPGSQILLKDGKSPEVPTHYAGGLRLRFVSPYPISGAEPPGQLVLLGTSAEPKIQLQSISGVRLERALDEHGQELVQVTSDRSPVASDPVFIGNFQGKARGIVGTGEQRAEVWLKAGAKRAKKLKQLTGTLSAQVQTPPEPIMTIADALKASGKSVKGKDGGALTLAEITRQDDGTVLLRAQLQLPANPMNGPRVIVVPARAQGIQLQVQVQQVQVHQRVGAGVMGPGDPMGLSLVDAQGKPYELVNIPRRGYRLANGVATHDLTLLFKPHKDQGDPAKLVYSSTRIVSVEVPFTLKDVPLP